MNSLGRMILVLLAGIFFGIVLTKGEIISWYRIYEMFRFGSFHMYGVIGSSALLGMLFYLSVKRWGIKSVDKKDIIFQPKDKGFVRYIAGGTLFGMGWALTGACPGPIYINIGNGYWMFGVVLMAAVAGTFVYGLIKNKLPH